jgi:hypothetical protein
MCVTVRDSNNLESIDRFRQAWGELQGLSGELSYVKSAINGMEKIDEQAQSRFVQNPVNE